VVSERAGVLLRAAREEDAAEIVAIYNEAVAHSTASFDTAPRSVDAQRRRIREHGGRHPFLVADEAGAVVGWATLSPWSDRNAYDRTGESSVYIRSDRRGQGLGRRLLLEILDGARAAGLHTVLARISAGNPASDRLHESLGFVRVGEMREVGYKFDRWVDVHLYQWMAEGPEPSSPDPGG
jgi:L-amino acid N-acyltransferase